VRAVALALALAIVAQPRAVTAQHVTAAQRVQTCVVDADDAEVTARLDWIEQRLDRGRWGGIAWWGGWMAYAAAEGAFGWVKYADTRDRLDRDTWLVTGVGSTLWVVQMLLFPMSSAYAPRRMRKLARATAGERRASLPKAERILRDAADSEHESLHWSEHLLDNAWALGTAAYIFGRSYGRGENARVWKETGIELGLTVLLTEGAILSTPRQAIRDVETYEKRPCVSEPAPTRATREPERPRVRFDLGMRGFGLRMQF